MYRATKLLSAADFALQGHLLQPYLIRTDFRLKTLVASLVTSLLAHINIAIDMKNEFCSHSDCLITAKWLKRRFLLPSLINTPYSDTVFSRNKCLLNGTCDLWSVALFLVLLLVSALFSSFYFSSLFIQLIFQLVFFAFLYLF